MGGQTGALPALEFLQGVDKLDLKIPLLCAGGVADGKSLRNALDMGYAGVQMGTRFLATHECAITDSYKNALVASTTEDVVLTNKLAGL